MIFKVFWAVRAILYKVFFGSIGNLSYMGAPVFLKGTRRIYIGNKVRIFPHYRMETYKNGSINIGDRCSIGQRFHVTASDDLVIGEDSMILFDVMITDIDHEYENVDVQICKQPFRVNRTIIGPNCFIGSGAKIQAGTILGRHCVVGANSVVRGVFPDYCVIVGAPAKVVKQYNFSNKQWEAVKR